MRNYYYVFVILLASFTIQAQSITGKIIDASNQPVAYATVMLYDQATLEMQKVQYSDDLGIFKFTDLKPNTYQLKVQYVGFPEFASNMVELGSRDLILDPFSLQEPSNELSEVLVTAKRPILEVKPDKMVFNVEGSINASGSDALELLRKAPGVMVDHNENVALLGKAGVKIYIDGKESPLSGDDLAAYLKGLQSDQIDRIEIVTNPSSKYDAEGNAGIIDIKLKRENKNGALTNLSTNTSVGIKSRYNLSANTNAVIGNSNIFLSANGGLGSNEENLALYREQSGVVLDQNGLNSNSWKYYSARLGIDHKLDDKHTLGLLVNLNRSDDEFKSTGVTPISMLETKDKIDSTLHAQSFNNSDSWNHSYNLNYRFANSNETSLNIDLDFGRYDREDFGHQPNEYLDPNNNLLRSITYETDAPTLIDIYTAKLDYEIKAFGGKLGTGLKFSKVITDNTFDFYNIVDGEPVLDVDRSNNFVYDEMISAAYLNFSAQYGKLGLQAGLRAEQTESEGILTAMNETNNDRVTRSYLDFFPSAGLNYPLNDKHNLNLSYSRRLNRPNYQDLNPFTLRLDEITFQQGNPFLDPEYSNNVQLTHTYNYSLNTTLSFAYTNDLIARITDASNVTNSFITWENVAQQYVTSLSISYPITVTDFWTSFVNLSGYRTSNSGDFDEGKSIDISINTFNGYNQNTFRLPNGWNLELSGWYLSPSVWEGNFKMDEIWSVDLGVQKQFLNDKAKVKLSVSDIFRTNKWAGVTTFGEQYLSAAGDNDSRRIRLNVSIALGRKDVKSRNRKTGLEDEAGRIKN